MRFLAENDPRRLVWEAAESPIEQFLCCGLFVILGCQAVDGSFDRAQLSRLAEAASGSPACFVFSQHSIGIYRADFLLVLVNPERRMAQFLVIECDGHAYHGSDEQIARDARRDAEIAAFGYRVVRFSGAAINGELRTVLADVRKWIEIGGARCEEMAFAAFLLKCTPERSVLYARQEERRKYWLEVEAEGQPDFADVDGKPGFWRDTL